MHNHEIAKELIVDIVREAGSNSDINVNPLRIIRVRLKNNRLQQLRY